METTADTMEKVLVIDDELGPRESMRMLLKNDYDVTCAASVDEGLTVLGTMSPDLIVMDIRMPGRSGIEGLGEIRKIDSKVSIVMLTGFGSLETAQQALRLGANDYLNKPFDTTIMRETVRRYIDRTKVERRRSGMMQELNDMNTGLINALADKEHMAALGESSAEIIHDLRNPLTIVTGYVELLSGEIKKTEDMNGQANDYLDIIGKNLKRCCELSQLWQKYSKNSAMTFQPVAVAELFDDIAAGAEPLASTSNVSIMFNNGCGADILVNGSGAQLVRAIHNVVANAIQATGPGDGLVTVTGKQVARGVEIVVTDNGCGIPEETRSQIFNPYFTTKGETDGTGLGLVITKKVMEEHQGTLEISSEPEKGTRVVMILPFYGTVA